MDKGLPVELAELWNVVSSLSDTDHLKVDVKGTMQIKVDYY